MGARDILKQALGVSALGLTLAVAAVSSASAGGRGGGGSGEQDSYLRQELQNPGYLNSRPTRFNYSRPWPEQYAEPAPRYYYPPPAYYGQRAPVRVWIPQ
jgi:hypothetical protein